MNRFKAAVCRVIGVNIAGIDIADSCIFGVCSRYILENACVLFAVVLIVDVKIIVIFFIFVVLCFIGEQKINLHRFFHKLIFIHLLTNVGK